MRRCFSRDTLNAIKPCKGFCQTTCVPMKQPSECHNCRLGELTPLRQTAYSLVQLRYTNVATPHSDHITNWSCIHGITTSESTLAELFAFEFKKASKKLEVSVWTVDQEEDGALVALNYAFLLQVAGMWVIRCNYVETLLFPVVFPTECHTETLKKKCGWR